MDILDLLNYRISGLEKNLKTVDDKIKNNYQHAFEWGYLSDKYTLELEMVKLVDFLNFVNKEPERTIEWLEFNIKEITSQLLRGKFTQQSSGQFSNMAYAISKELDVELLGLYKFWLKQINM